MSRPDPTPEPEHPIDAIVGAYLRRQADQVDARRVLRRVRATQPGAPRRRLRRALWGLATAAAVVAAFLGGHYLGPAPAARASAEAIVREARQAHALPLDRCYLVQPRPEPGTDVARYPRLAQPRETRLWTRGDRFHVRSTDPDRRWAWGRDENGSVWIALGRRHGVRYEPQEVPPPVAVVCEVLSMRVETLLDEVLGRFDLHHEAEAAAATHRIRAELKPGRRARGLGGAVLEVDAQTRVLRRLVLHRTTPAGAALATVTFTLVDTTPQPDGDYTLQGHLDPDAVVFTPAHRHRQRAFLMRRFFGLPLAPGRRD